MSLFKKAERRQAKLKIAITGPSGSGKTFSSLRLAKGIGSKIAVIDTENGSASLYADRFEFDTLTIQPPYTIAKYNEALRAAVAEGYDVVVIDSLSHAWAGDGGLLAKKEAMDARGGNSYTNWAGITKEHEAFKALLLNSDAHLVCTMRSKQDYVLETNDKGKQAPRKVGLAPIQRDGMEYEFTTVFDVAMDHNASTSKDRTGLFDGVLETISEDTGKKFVAWLNGAKPAEQRPEADVPASDPSRDALYKRLMPLYEPFMKANPGLNVAEFLHGRYHVGETRLMNVPQLEDLVNYMESSFRAGKPVQQAASAPRQPSPMPRGPSEKQVNRLFAIANKAGWDSDQVHTYMRDKFQIESVSHLSRDQYDDICQIMESLANGEPGMAG